MNNSSAKTKNLIRQTFAEMLNEKKEIGKISVTELVRRADINRSTFYSHYNDIYGVAEDYENELINFFFDNVTLLKVKNSDQFFEKLLEYFGENKEYYRMMCKSNDMLYSATKLTRFAEKQLMEICGNSKSLKDKKMMEIDLCVFVEGLVFQYIKFCRGYSERTPEDLIVYAKIWRDDFMQRYFF